MKKRNFLLVGALALVLASCQLPMTVHYVTNNPVGVKSGTAKATVFSKDPDFSYSTAAKQGGVNKIGTSEIRYGLFSVKTTVTGE